MTHVHRITGENVTVTGRVNGVVIFDTDDEQGEELLDSVFDAQFDDSSDDWDEETRSNEAWSQVRGD
jgi:hypothetical protein